MVRNGEVLKCSMPWLSCEPQRRKPPGICASGPCYEEPEGLRLAAHENPQIQDPISMSENGQLLFLSPLQLRHDD